MHIEANNTTQPNDDNTPTTSDPSNKLDATQQLLTVETNVVPDSSTELEQQYHTIYETVAMHIGANNPTHPNTPTAQPFYNETEEEKHRRITIAMGCVSSLTLASPTSSEGVSSSSKRVRSSSRRRSRPNYFFEESSKEEEQKEDLI
eukprot:15296861-Ditylum_brightwellii.AAC.1